MPFAWRRDGLRVFANAEMNHALFVSNFDNWLEYGIPQSHDVHGFDGCV